MPSAVYKITCTANGRYYWGSSMNFQSRWRQHRNDLAAGRHRNPLLQRCYDKHGEESLHFEVVLLCDPDTRLWFEDRLLARDAQKNPLCMNIALSASAPALGRVDSPETTRRRSESHKGLKHSDETKAKIGAAHRGRKKSRETIEKMRAAQTRKTAVRIYHEAGWSLELDSEVAADRYLGFRKQYMHDKFRHNGDAFRPRHFTLLGKKGITFVERI